MKKYRKNIFLFLPLMFLILSCSSNKGYAPKRISGYIIQTTSMTADRLDKSWLSTEAYYSFHSDQTYQLTAKGEDLEVGEYSYRKTGSNKCEIVLDYAKDTESGIYTLFLEFTTAGSGNWQAHYTYSYNDKEIGTFKVVKKEAINK